MAIPDGYRGNFITLKRAFDHEDAALVECTDKKTGKPVYVICAMEVHGEETEMKPFAKMFDDNPYEEVDPPK